MVENNLQGLLEQASETGARRALAQLGLDDASAAKGYGRIARAFVRMARRQTLGA